MEKTHEIDALIAYVREHYDDGGHWIFETHDRADYEQILVNLKTLAKAKAYVRRRWQDLEQQCRAVQAEIF